MASLLHNISLILLSTGFLLTIIYFTIFITKQNIKQTCSNNNNNNNNNNIKSIYDERPSIVFADMFQRKSLFL